MERAAWTNERLDDLAESVRGGFARLDQDVRDLRSEMNGGHASLRSEMAAVREELSAVRQLMLQFAGVTLVGFISVLAAILARGV